MRYQRLFLSLMIAFASFFYQIPAIWAQNQLSIESPSSKMNVRGTLQFTAKLNSENVTYPDITWHSSFPSIASINSDGLLTAYKKGNTQVYASFGGTEEFSQTISSNVIWVSVVQEVGDVEPRRSNNLPRLNLQLGSDSDGDGLADSVEEKLGSNSESIDTDSDGVEDLQEILAGTNPRNRGPLFSDLDDVDWARDHIIKLSQYGIIKGFSDNSFRPKANITRAELLKTILEASGVKVKTFAYDSDLPFTDIDLSSWQYPYINYAYSQGLVKGYDNGTFKPNRAISRIEAVKIILEAIGVGKATSTNSSFWDLKTPWAIPYVERAFELGLINGYPDGSFKPMQNISRAEASKIIAGLL